MKKYLVSGLGPGTGGVGRFFSRLSTVAAAEGWKVLWRPASRDEGTVRYILDVFRFYARLLLVRKAKLVVLHPQTLRWRWFFRLAGSNRMSLFVMDNSFFCIRSYNYREPGWGECLDCLGDISRCHASCRPFPVLYDRNVNLIYLDRLRKAAEGITFLVQNPKQGLLVEKHFGSGVKVRVVGMVTDEFEKVSRRDQGSGRFDVVYHGAILAPKGAHYAMELARRLPELSFLLPGKRDDAAALAGDAVMPENVDILDVTWETGLREHVQNCNLVLCPSMWSAPVEGALVKSILHNGRVAVFETEYGYQADLPDGLVTRLDSDLAKAAQKVRQMLHDEVDDELINNWIEDMLEGAALGSVFT